MKQGISLTQMAEELTHQVESKKDFLADTRNLAMMNDTKVQMIGSSIEGPPLPLNRIAHTQVAQRLGIPQAYYDRMLAEEPDLLANNVNRWFNHKPEQRMLRTLDGEIRAFLSHKYRALDNYDLAQIALPALSQAGCEVKSCALTPSHMFIKAVTPRITSEITKGDIVQAGIVISNSEVGHGSLRVEPLIFRLVCLNGMISEASIRKYHVGAKWNALESEEVQELLTDEARRADDKAFWLKARDVIQGALNQMIFEKLVDRLRTTTEERLEKGPSKVIELTAKRFNLSGDESENVLTHLIQGGDLSRYGVMNAVTRASQDVEDYNRATELERLGGQIIELNKQEWQEIAA